ncbi:hypothetical protein [Clostridium sp. OM05-9BH]|nr:hypothetical protein [Clostridium sp. OM05-9BH]
MSGYSDTEQYVYVLEAGRILRKIHSIPAPATQEDWEIRFNRIVWCAQKAPLFASGIVWCAQKAPLFASGIVWCAQKAPLFASGIVNGYFDDNVPMGFWRLLALYISSNTLSSVYSSIVKTFSRSIKSSM